jgi:mRNA-degrading endonuclease RelE of RelBE toxin-antitoxin system
LIFKETSVFTEQVSYLLTSESYRLLQLRLASMPDAGAVIKGTGGLRKIRWRGATGGKRGGVRVIYYWVPSDNLILFLLAYPKTAKDDLTSRQMKVLAALVQEEFK